MSFVSWRRPRPVAVVTKISPSPSWSDGRRTKVLLEVPGDVVFRIGLGARTCGFEPSARSGRDFAIRGAIAREQMRLLRVHGSKSSSPPSFVTFRAALPSSVHDEYFPSLGAIRDDAIRAPSGDQVGHESSVSLAVASAARRRCRPRSSGTSGVGLAVAVGGEGDPGAVR